MRNLLINSYSLSFDIISCSLQEKFLTVGCVWKRPWPIAFTVRSAGQICFLYLDHKNPGVSRYDSESRLHLKRTITNLCDVYIRQYRIILMLNTEKNDDIDEKLQEVSSFLTTKNDDTNNFWCFKTENFSTRESLLFELVQTKLVHKVYPNLKQISNMFYKYFLTCSNKYQ